MSPFLLTDVFSKTVTVFRARFLVLIVAAVIYFVLIGGLSWILDDLRTNIGGVWLIAGSIILEVAVGFLALISYLHALLKIARGQLLKWSDIVGGWGKTVQFFVAMIILFFAVGIGFLLLIVPGIYLSLRYSQVAYAVLDGKGILGSFKYSALITKGVKWKLFLLWLVLGILSFVGSILIFIAVFSGIGVLVWGLTLGLLGSISIIVAAVLFAIIMFVLLTFVYTLSPVIYQMLCERHAVEE